MRNLKYNITNTYLRLNPGTVLINCHSIRDNSNISIAGYVSNNFNTRNELNNGSAVLVQQNIENKINDGFITDILEMIQARTVSKVSVPTTYLPARRPHLLSQIFRNNIHSTYIIGDLNAHQILFGYNTNNTVGNSLETCRDVHENRETYTRVPISQLFIQEEKIQYRT